MKTFLVVFVCDCIKSPSLGSGDYLINQIGNTSHHVCARSHHTLDDRVLIVRR